MNEVEEGKAVREGLREALRQLQPFSLQEVENNQAKFLTPFSLLLRQAAEIARGSGLQNFELKYELVKDGGANCFLSVLDDDRLKPLHPPTLLVIHKLTRHPDVARVLYETNALERVGRHTSRPEARHLAVMTSANLIRDDEHALKAHVVTDDVISTLLQTLRCVLDDRPTPDGISWGPTALFQSVMILSAGSDTNKEILIKHGVVGLIERVLTDKMERNARKRSEDLTIYFAAEALFHLCFLKKNQAIVKKNDSLIAVLRDLASVSSSPSPPSPPRSSSPSSPPPPSSSPSSSPSYSSTKKQKREENGENGKRSGEEITEKVVKSANGVLFLLSSPHPPPTSASLSSSSLTPSLSPPPSPPPSSSSSSPSSSSSSTSSDSEFDVMISYNWSESRQHAMALKVLLTDLGQKVWVDEQEMRGSIIEKMAEGVEKSRVLLVCVGEKYQLSAACRLECEYASVLKKPIVPVKTRECVPSGWLGLILGSKKYYQLPSDLLSVDFPHLEVVQELVRDLSFDLKTTKKERKRKRKRDNRSPPPLPHSQEVDEWNSQEVGKWLKGRGVGEEGVKGVVGEGVDGVGLRELWKVYVNCTPLFFEMCGKMGVGKVGEQLKLAALLRGLFA